MNFLHQDFRKSSYYICTDIHTAVKLLHASVQVVTSHHQINLQSLTAAAAAIIASVAAYFLCYQKLSKVPYFKGC